MPLQEEIETRRRAIKTDSYSMSLGELMNLYQSQELDLHPDFQRFFRWTDRQKTKLIESILLGIPLPPIFVSQRKDGVWDVIDGLQRLSAIFQFGGILRNDEEALWPSLKLTKAKYLPSLEGKVWEIADNPESPDALSAQQRIDIKRSKLDVNIILRESSPDAKYDLFERLNTGGTQLSEQEMRNCLLLMSNKEFFKRIEQLASYPMFTACTSLSDKAKEERYDMELIVRFITLRAARENDLRGIGDVGTFLTDRIIALSEAKFNLDGEENIFRKAFDILNAALCEESFRRYNVEKARFMGGFLVSVFEVIGIGLSHNIEKWGNSANDLEAIRVIAQSIWQNPDFTNHQGSGVGGASRILHTVPLGRALFAR
ncbi:MAG: DUF262 domain-containing protein [Rhodomicrobium sp.]